MLGNFVDPDARDGEMTLTLSVSGDGGGIISASGTSLDVDDNGTDTVTVRGTLADLNAALNGGGFTYTAAAEGEVEIGVTLNDQGNTGEVFNPLEDTASITLTVEDIQVEARDLTMGVTRITDGWRDGGRSPDQIRMPASAFLRNDIGEGLEITGIYKDDPSDSSDLDNFITFDQVCPRDYIQAQEYLCYRDS